MNKQDIEQFKEFHTKLDTISDCVSKISFTINSDEDTKRIGMAEQTQINTKDISELRTENKVRVGRVGVIMSIVGVVFGAIGGFAAKYFLK